MGSKKHKNKSKKNKNKKNKKNKAAPKHLKRKSTHKAGAVNVKSWIRNIKNIAFYDGAYVNERITCCVGNAYAPIDANFYCKPCDAFRKARNENDIVTHLRSIHHKKNTQQPREWEIAKLELCVFAFIRIHCVTCTMPKDLQQMCFSFYFDLLDEWNAKTSKEISIDTHTRTVKIKDPLNGGYGARGWYNAFGKIIVQKGQLNEWRFCIQRNSVHGGVSIFIGIVETRKVSSQMHTFFANINSTLCGYAFYTYQGNKYSPTEYSAEYGPKARSDDTVTMILDMTQKKQSNATLSFKVNDTSLGYAFNDIDIEQEYCMAVALYDVNDHIQIIE